MKKDRKSIGFFTIDYSAKGGVERVTSVLSSLFIKRGMKVSHIVSLYEELSPPAMVYDDSLQIEVLNPSSKSEIEDLMYQFLLKAKLDFLIFQADNMSISLSILKATDRANVKAIAHYHGTPYAYLKKFCDAQKKNWHKKFFAQLVYPFKKAKMKTFVKNAHQGLVCVSQGISNELIHLLGKNTMKNATVIHNPLSWQKHHFNAQENKRVCFISRIEARHKNAFLAVQMWEIVSKSIPDWEFHIYGSGPLEKDMLNYIKKKNIPRIFLRGFLSNIDEEMKQGAISISTSNCEGFSMAILEAASFGHAIATTNSYGGIHDMIIDKETGLISPRNDAKALAENVIKLIQNPNLRKTLATNLQNHITNIYATDIVEKWQKLLCEDNK